MQIGKYKLSVVNTGYFRLDGGAMFGIIPKNLWEKTNPPDDQNRIKLATKNLLLENRDRKILVDTGMGNKWNDKAKAIYNIDQEKHSIELSLGELNIKSEDITDVILTHLHFDHTGGSTKSENGKIIPTFSNATYYVQKKNYEWAMNPSDRDRGSYLKENFVPLFDEGILKLLNEGEKFDDEIDFLIVNGHTFAQQLLKISDSTNTIMYCCDLFPTTSHIPIPYVMGYDLQPLLTVAEKKKILPKAVDEDWKLFFEHDPETVFATVINTEKGFKIGEKFDKLG
jgi:glyoxylase-like metal-dependent hydrolase (beta-lactamase superfamily II)